MTGHPWQHLYDAIAGLASEPVPLRDRLREIDRRYLAKIEVDGPPAAIAAGLADFRASMERMGNTLAPTEDLDFEARVIAEGVLHMYDRMSATMHDLPDSSDSTPGAAYDQSWELLHRTVESFVADNGPLVRRLVWGAEDGIGRFHDNEIPPEIADELADVTAALGEIRWAYDKGAPGREDSWAERLKLDDANTPRALLLRIVAMYARVGRYQDIDSVDDDLTAGC